MAADRAGGVCLDAAWMALTPADLPPGPADAGDTPPFTRDAMAALFGHSAGAARTHDTLTGLAIFLAKLERAPQVTAAHVQAAIELAETSAEAAAPDAPAVRERMERDRRPPARGQTRIWVALTAAAVALSAAATIWLAPTPPATPPARPPVTVELVPQPTPEPPPAPPPAEPPEAPPPAAVALPPDPAPPLAEATIQDHRVPDRRRPERPARIVHREGPPARGSGLERSLDAYRDVMGELHRQAIAPAPPPTPEPPPDPGPPPEHFVGRYVMGPDGRRVFIETP